MSFVHLHNHSEYSLLNGAIRIPQLVKKAREYGMPAVALTDYGNIFGAVDFFLEAREQKIKPIIGCVVFHPSHDQHQLRQQRRGLDYLFQLVLLIQNREGYHNLCQLLTRSYLDGFYYKPRIDSSLLREYNQGIIALSSGWDGAINHYLFDGQKKKALEAMEQYAQIFPERFYIELQENGIEGQHAMNLELLEMASSKGLPVVASNNCHYMNRDDAEAFETMMCIQLGATLYGTNDQLKFSTDEYHFKSPLDMQEDFAYCPEALAVTEQIAAQCDFQFDLKTYHFPKFEPPKNLTLDAYLHKEAASGLQNRWPEILRHYQKQDQKTTLVTNEITLRKRYEERLEEELGIIKKMGFSGYFLIVADFILYAKSHDIPVGPGRGSAAGSLVAYCTQITDLDPLPYHLLFERFLNPERISMPDVDIDFCMHGRDQVLAYVAKKFGNVSQIITFGKMKAKAVIRDVGRVMEMPYEDVDRIAKLVPNALNITLEQALEQEPRLREMVAKDAQVARLIAIAKRLEGLNRHASTHAAGVVISDKPLTEFVPLYKGSKDDVVTQFDMKCVEKIGLIKFDFLGLKTLTFIQDTLKIISRTRNRNLKILDIPLDDPEVYALIARGDTSGVFQLESSGMRDLMVRLKPTCFEDLIALVALYRPGPLGSGMVDDFINRKQDKKVIHYDLKQLEPILQDTYGVIVYQEQVMQIASVLAGYSLGEADLLRRAMGKKKVEEMASQKLRFLQGAMEKKIPIQKAEKIFDLMAKFAEYGFNKSHSAAYALVSYQTAYLKTHFPVEFMAAMLTIEMQNTDKVLYYIQDCEAHGIKILPPDVNDSYHGFSVLQNNLIRYGLGALKGVGRSAIDVLVSVREKVTRFESFFHFCDLVDHHRVNRRVLESLIKCGAFDGIAAKRAALMAVLDQAVDLAIKKQAEEGTGQTSLFGLLEGSNCGKPVGMDLPQIPDWTEIEKLGFEKEAVGFYLTGHPLKSYADEIQKVITANSQSCRNLPNQTEIILAGMVSQQKLITTKKGSRMAFVTFEDLKGQIEIIVFADLFQKAAELLGLDKPLVVTGSTDRTDDGVKLIAKEIHPLMDYMARKTRSVHFKIPSQICTHEKLAGFHSILGHYKGSCKGYLHLILPGESDTIMELPEGIALDDSESLMLQVNTLFEQKVVDYN